MPKRKTISEFEIRLRAWQKSKKFNAKEAAEFLGVNLGTYRHWWYGGITPSSSKCLACIESKLKEQQNKPQSKI